MASSFEIERARKQQDLGIIPYQGTEPFIFVSYAHRDFVQVLPMIKALIDHGFRVWYDEGIDPSSEWDDNIAAHVKSCYCMLSFLSGNYLASKYCLRELRFGDSTEKKLLFIYLEDVKLPDGLEMRFGHLQAIHQYTYSYEEAFYEKLFSAKVLAPTLQTAASVPQVAKPTVRKPDLQAIAALFKFEQVEDCITITKLKDTNRTVIEIPWGVTKIESSTFLFTKLTSITIPESVTSIGKLVFADCTRLTSVTIPDSVTSIEYQAFARCTGLTSITIPDSVTSIEKQAFYRCASLTSVAIPDSVTSIGAFAFAKCKSLTSITLPDRVTSIGVGAFVECENLTIYGKQGSFAEQYAQENSIPFQAM